MQPLANVRTSDAAHRAARSLVVPATVEHSGSPCSLPRWPVLTRKSSFCPDVLVSTFRLQRIQLATFRRLEKAFPSVLPVLAADLLHHGRVGGLSMHIVSLFAFGGLYRLRGFLLRSGSVSSSLVCFLHFSGRLFQRYLNAYGLNAFIGEYGCQSANENAYGDFQNVLHGRSPLLGQS